MATTLTQDATERTAADGSDEQVSPDHLPFRSWALQQDLISLLGDRHADTEDLGIESPDSSSIESVRGQSFLRVALTPDKRYVLRTRAAIALYTAALLTDILVQVSPIGVAMPGGTFVAMVALIVAAIIAIATIWPRLSPKAFPIGEQFAVYFGYSIIALQCAQTGGAESPYIAWYALASMYSGYFAPPRLGFSNLVAATVFALVIFAAGDPNPNGTTAIIFGTVIAVSWLLVVTLMRQRHLEVNLERAVQFLALADPLTGVANVRALEQFIAKLNSQGDAKFSLVMADMNGLKGANTVFGHETGDGMILRLSKLMLEASRPSAQVARIGGDEFAVVLPDGDEHEVDEWQSRFTRLVDEHNTRVKGRLPQISAATGFAHAPADGTAMTDLLDAADRSMYEQKTPAVTPPYEIEGPAARDTGRRLRIARFADAPRRAIDARDTLNHATLNWIAVGSITLSTLVLPSELITTWAVLAVGALGYSMALLSQAVLRNALFRPMVVLIDVITLIYGPLALLATGGPNSPIQMASLIPAAFYAQYLRGSRAIGRIAALIGLYSLAFWASGDPTLTNESFYVVIIIAIIFVAGILQMSSSSMRKSLAIVRDSATRDPLTRIPNLHAFRADLAKVIARAGKLEGSHVRRPALLLADIDNFSEINTNVGHRGGDLVLLETVQRLQTAIGNRGTAYRIGGDEFAVLFEAERYEDAVRTADGCRKALAFRSESPEAAGLNVSSSVGVAAWKPHDNEVRFVESVEMALGKSKATRRGGDGSRTNVML